MQIDRSNILFDKTRLWRLRPGLPRWAAEHRADVLQFHLLYEAGIFYLILESSATTDNKVSMFPSVYRKKKRSCWNSCMAAFFENFRV